MANLVTTNPWVIDSTGHLVNVNGEVMISGILVNPSGATWSVIIKDGAGNIIFQQNELTKDGGGPTVPFKSTGFNVTTLTSITNILVYRVPS